MSPVKYSTSDLLELRASATQLADLKIDICEEIDKRFTSSSKASGRTPVDQNTVIKFRKAASPKEIKFVEDLDIPITQIIHAYNLSDGVTWPILKTFCEKTVGVPSLDVRMMRRRKPAEARIIFRSIEEAHKFLAQVPTNASIKGRTPKFELECTAPKHSPAKIEDVYFCTVVESGKGSASAVVESGMPTAAVEVAQMAQMAEVEDDCCAKASPKKVEQEAMVPSAVAIDMSKVSKSQGSFTKGGKRSGASRTKTGTVVGISLDHLRRNSGVEMGMPPGAMFQLDTNVQV